jgi:aminomethyltransferase
MSHELLNTPLTQRHEDLGARMGPFAGYSMPISYLSITDEHNAVRQKAGAFDVSHMGRLVFDGDTGVDALERLVTIHVEALVPGRAKYGFVLNDKGGVIDDVILYNIDGIRRLLVVNASNRPAVLARIAALRLGENVFADDTDVTGMIAVQGPTARDVVAQIVDLPEIPNASMRIAATEDAILTTTGYTGEDGVEIIVPAEKTPGLWDFLLESGALPCGLGARDTLRLEMGYPLYGHELSEAMTPWQARLGWGVDTANEVFSGRESVMARKDDLVPRMTALECDGRAVPRTDHEVLRDGTVVGHVSSGTFSPSLGKGIALAFLDPDVDMTETGLTIAPPGRPSRAIGARIVKLPFYHEASRRSSSP